MSLLLRALLCDVDQYNTTVSEGIFKAVLDQSCRAERWHPKHDRAAVFECGFKKGVVLPLIWPQKMGLDSWAD